ncbi:hypothetical protein N5J43_17960 [Pseudomonas nicosulfuronedens]|uniref:Lipoprotein n=1 Tax=Pseudomonas nicosulfuronedens TaxID=2571105 RepID=A0A5R9R103_9PSED|nr:hypothetical protein [Pseudomonas nicosulfuronedens]MDH1008634.1 hypothetical protein [Pseudomonas nicosulfuronedens]MDH1980843.1 hypothetical protein [Pseudomonas nicosulfuronedens]MDH2028867.1 hypothetical protein [Pseudomonas nicosulfuronedens]TLX76266.1 hypothetical protein FAS41_14860 [Pseudomonas nicosulfuronedens]
MIRWLSLAFALLLAGCAQHAPLPSAMPSLSTPMQLHIQREQGHASQLSTQDWLLVIQQEGAALRWSLIDPLGIPLSRQLLREGEWSNDGLLPPNPEARELFAVLLFALTPEGELASRYPAKDYRSDDPERHLQQRWKITYRSAQDFTLESADLRYRVTPLDSESAAP